MTLALYDTDLLAYGLPILSGGSRGGRACQPEGLAYRRYITSRILRFCPRRREATLDRYEVCGRLTVVAPTGRTTLDLV